MPLALGMFLAATMVPCALSFHVSTPVNGLRSGGAALGHRSGQCILPVGPRLGEHRSRPARQGQPLGGLKASIMPAIAPAIQVCTKRPFHPAKPAQCFHLGAQKGWHHKWHFREEDD